MVSQSRGRGVSEWWRRGGGTTRLAALPVASAPVLIGSRVVGGFGGHGESWHACPPGPYRFFYMALRDWGPPIMSLLRAPRSGREIRG